MAASWPADAASAAAALNRRMASSARPVSRAISARVISSHTRAPSRVGGAGLLGGGLDELACRGVAAAVGEGVGLVDEVAAHAAAGLPAGQRGLQLGGAA